MNYSELYNKSLINSESFWKEQAHALECFSKPNTIISKNTNDYPIWYEDGELNICYLAIDKHIQDGFGDEVAVIYDSPVTQTIKKYTLKTK